MHPYKTPLRYPGGKQKLAPFISEVMRENGLVGAEYAEVYAGGAGVAIELLLNGTATHIHLNDASPAVYAFWRSILTKTDDFCRRVGGVSLTVDEWRRQREILRNPTKHSQFEVGFSLFYLNRCNRSGIPSGGVIGGLDQSGPWKIDARFPRRELIQRIEAIAARRRAITVRNDDGEDFIRTYVPKLPRKALVYCDPPYFQQGRRLYLNRYQPEDHVRVASVIQRHLKRPWIVSYDNAPEIRRCYVGRKAFAYTLQYSAASVYRGTEVFIFSDRLVIPKKSVVECIQMALSA